MLDVDALGLDVMDRKLLLAVIEKFAGGPVGLENLAHAIGEEADTIEDVLEPYLIQQGYLQRTPRGRIATLDRLPALRPRRARRGARPAVRQLEASPFSVPVRVYYQDTDAGGVVFHAQYLAFMERARTELLNAARHRPGARSPTSDRVLFLVYRDRGQVPPAGAAQRPARGHGRSG